MASKYGYRNGQMVNMVTGLAPTEDEKVSADKAHSAVMAADEAYQTALEKAYGKRAGDIRYQPSKQTADIKALGDAYKVSLEAWRATWESK